MRLDLEDVLLGDQPERAGLLPAALVDRAREVSFPQRADGSRGALASFVPLYSLLLEVLAVRWRRGQTVQLLAILHLIAEYGGHLVWESVLGHPADPARLANDVGGRASRWADLDDDDCAHNRSQRYVAVSIRDREPATSPHAWQRYLREEFSRVGDALTVCSTRDSSTVWGVRPRSCQARCSVWTRYSDDQRAQLENGTRLVVLMSRSPLLQLRHSAPIGHFFGVPELDEVSAEWDALASRIARDTGVELTGDSVVAQAADLCTEMAGVQIGPSDLIGQTVRTCRELLDSRAQELDEAEAVSRASRASTWPDSSAGSRSPTEA